MVIKTHVLCSTNYTHIMYLAIIKINYDTASTNYYASLLHIMTLWCSDTAGVDLL